jgi:competence protein ComEA
MIWLNRLQQRLSLTRNESLALLSLSGLLMIGLAARHVQRQAVPVPVGAYDEMDRLFFERSAAVESSPDTSRADFEMDALRYREGGSSGSTLRIDLNAAAPQELELLPRIGPKMAERILAFRAAFGPFGAVDDLRQIRGIGERTLELIRPHVFVSHEEADTLPP